MKGDSIADVPSVYGNKGIASPANKPGARYASVGWTDKTGNLWLFGGDGETNDLWRYHISSNTWTWISGDSTENAQGFYGTKGVSSRLINLPEDRMLLPGQMLIITYGYLVWQQSKRSMEI
jgi:hypothetical protein